MGQFIYFLKNSLAAVTRTKIIGHIASVGTEGGWSNANVRLTSSCILCQRHHVPGSTRFQELMLRSLAVFSRLSLVGGEASMLTQDYGSQGCLALGVQPSRVKN